MKYSFIDFYKEFNKYINHLETYGIFMSVRVCVYVYRRTYKHDQIVLFMIY